MTGAGSGFHDRTALYTGGFVPVDPIGVSSGAETASTVAGQVAVLSAVNIAARSHPHLFVAVPDIPMLVPSPCGGEDLTDACVRLASAIHPDLVMSVVDAVPAEVRSLGVGADAGRATIYAGGARWTGRTAQTPVEVTDDPSSVLGASFAVTAGLGAMFRDAIGRPAVLERSVSLWTLSDYSGASGPAACGPLDLGSVWVVGAGAVGSALAWWASLVGTAGPWVFVDGDLVELSNLNRSLALFAAHAGLTGTAPWRKADAAAALLPGAVAKTMWWHEWVAEEQAPPDVLIPVANDRGVRAAVTAFGHPATLHATTGPDWTAELHRHLLGRDGCMGCRGLREAAPRFACATDREHTVPEDNRRDAALPFLSAAAGLLLTAGLLQVQAGQWPSHQDNHWQAYFDDSSPGVRARRWSCERPCAAVPPPVPRRAVHGETRWSFLDGAGTT